MKPNSVVNHTLKKSYDTKAEAEKVAAYLLTKFIQVRVYKCFCEKFHLTGNNKGK